MTKGRLCEFSTVTINDRSMTDWSLIVTVLNSCDVMTDQIFSCCRVIVRAIYPEDFKD